MTSFCPIIYDTCVADYTTSTKWTILRSGDGHLSARPVQTIGPERIEGLRNFKYGENILLARITNIHIFQQKSQSQSHSGPLNFRIDDALLVTGSL